MQINGDKQSGKLQNLMQTTCEVNRILHLKNGSSILGFGETSKLIYNDWFVSF